MMLAGHSKGMPISYTPQATELGQRSRIGHNGRIYETLSDWILCYSQYLLQYQWQYQYTHQMYKNLNAQFC